MMKVFNPLIKLYWRFTFAFLTLWYPGKELTLLNVGYADMGEVQGLFLEDPYRKLLDRYRLQLYHKIVIENGNIDTMEGKTLLETGCGRGGGLDYLAIKLKP